MSSANPYLTKEELLRSVKNLSGTSITDESFTDIITDESCIVNGILGQRYKLPIPTTNEAAYGIVKAIVRYRCLVRIELFLKVKSSTKKGSQEVIDAASFSKEIKQLNMDLKEGTLQLPGVERVDNLVAYNFPEGEYRDFGEGPNW